MKPRTAAIRWAILDLVAAHPHDLARVVAERFGISRQAVLRHVNALIEERFLTAAGTTRKTYALGVNRDRVRAYALSGLDEWTAWAQDFSGLLDILKPNVNDIVHRGFTEMVNNAIDHSGGTEVIVGTRVHDGQFEMVVMDNGEGIFRRIARLLELPDERLALLELSKGKLTTDPANHSGEGIFFTSRMFDRFSVRSGSFFYSHDSELQFDWIDELPSFAHGTIVTMSIPCESDRTANEVYEAFYAGPEDLNFNKTVVPMRLARFGNENLVSRSQAKRVTARFEKFRVVILDFEGVPEIGQGFADELFRVFAREHPEIDLLPVHCTPAVQDMIARAISTVR